MTRLLAALAILASASAHAQDRIPVPGHVFERYKAGPVYSDTPARPTLGKDRTFHEFRTAIRDGTTKGVNFAGHYRLIQVGCGSGCLFVFMVDVRTGMMKPSLAHEPVGNTDFRYRKNSRLVLFVRYEDQHCFSGKILWTGSHWRQFPETDLGTETSCLFARG
ncbi:MAG: hypothetical protein U1E62_17280 [Alsobacter sp.]